MARRRHTPEQAIRKLREGENLLNEGKNIDELNGTCESFNGRFRDEFLTCEQFGSLL